MRNLRTDPRFIFFALGAALALLISAPNTYQIAAPLHGADSGWYGAALTVALVVLLEAGAIGAEIAGVRWLCFGLLALTFVANCAIGSAAFGTADLSALPSLLAWRASGYGWVLVLCYSASVPILLYTFLHFAIVRAHELSAARAQPERTPAQEVAHELRTLVDTLRTLALLPEQPIYAAPREERTQPVTEPNFTCGICGIEASTHQRRGYAQHKAWICKGCGKRHTGL